MFACRLLLFAIFLLLSSVAVFPQISQGGIPYSWSRRSIKTPSCILLPHFEQKGNKLQNTSKNGGFLFAKVIDVQIDNNKNGTWNVLPNGDKIWQVAIKSEGAYSLNFTFSKFIIPYGAEVFVFSPDKRELLGAFTAENMKSWQGLSVAPIKGDELIIEYYEPQNADFQGILEINRMGHDMVDIFSNKDGYFGRSGACNIDINCSEGKDWQKEKRAVCRLIVNNDILCTGTLINTTENDETPYILTANHCVSSKELAQKTVFYFNYESSHCNDKDGDDSQTVSGAELVATKNNNNGYLDFSLLKLSKKVPKNYKPYFAGWYVGRKIAKNTACIHHPEGDVKKISLSEEAPEVTSYEGTNYDKNTFWLVKKWHYGTTEQGSSGSPLFNEKHQIIGILSGGYANCNLPEKDIYQMLSMAYDKYKKDSLQLKKWLNPNILPIMEMQAFGYQDTTSFVSENKTTFQQVKIYPNPATTHFDIEFLNTKKNVTFLIYNYLGKIIYKEYLESVKTHRIDLQKFDTGFYLLICKTEKNIFMNKFTLSK